MNSKHSNEIVLQGWVTFCSPVGRDVLGPRIVCEIATYDFGQKYQCVAIGASALAVIRNARKTRPVTLRGRLRQPTRRTAVPFVDVDHAEPFTFPSGPSDGRSNPSVRLVGVVRNAARTTTLCGDELLHLTVETHTSKAGRLACDQHVIEYFLCCDMLTAPLPEPGDCVEVTGGVLPQYARDARGRSVPSWIVCASTWQIVKRGSRLKSSDTAKTSTLVALPSTSLIP